MDNVFFSQRLLVIARHTYQKILYKTNRLYYYKYMCKMNYQIKSLEYKGKDSIKETIEYVNGFEYKQSQRVKNGVFIKPKYMLELVCRDIRDVLESMKRFEGVGVENWNWNLDNSKVNFGSRV